MKLVRTFSEVRSLAHGTVGLVPTLGGLHEGHASLIRRATQETQTTVASVFVNPLQFAPTEDLDTYPGDIDDDAEMAAEAGVDVLFAPPVAEVYPVPPAIRIIVGDDHLAHSWEAESRPDHFEGVAIVVAKLFAGIQPDRAYFGQKDAQQLAIVRRMTRDLSFPVEVAALPTVRDEDGLALSTRNRYLDVGQRRRAVALSRGLFAAADAAEGGERDAEELVGRARSEMEGETEVDYVALVDESTFSPVAMLEQPCVLICAARVGPARLIDNVPLRFVGDEVAAERGVRLDRRSVVEET